MEPDKEVSPGKHGKGCVLDLKWSDAMDHGK